MTAGERFIDRQLEHLLTAGRKRDLTGRILLAQADCSHDLGACSLKRDAARRQRARRESLLFAQQAKQDVLGTDIAVAQRPRLLLGEDNDLAGALCESLKQSSKDLIPRGGGQRCNLPEDDAFDLPVEA